MTLQTLVSIYGVDETGATGAQLGSGTLIGPVLVLLHPPLSRRLAGSGNSTRLRVGIARAGTAPHDVEVIDGSDIYQAVHDSGEPLVALELRQPTSAPVELVFPPSDDGGEIADALVKYLAGLPDSDCRPEYLPEPSPSEPDSPPWCTIWPNGPGCS